MDNLIDNKYGYVENTPHDTHYKNIDYRDTIVSLWNTLYNQYTNNIEITNTDIKQINIALCATIIQLAKLNIHNNNNNYCKIQELKLEIINREKKSVIKKIENKKKKIQLLEIELQLLETELQLRESELKTIEKEV
tara:strand:- start:153 stop:560 length:408 start_codon:yes stop_codon:yes gene_type:complete